MRLVCIICIVNYSIGIKIILLFHFRVLLHDKESQKHDIVSSFCEELYQNGNRSPFLLALLVDMCDDHISQGSAGDSVYNVDRAKSLCSDLATKYDTVRCKYWDYMASTIEKKAKGQDTSEASASKEENIQ